MIGLIGVLQDMIGMYINLGNAEGLDSDGQPAQNILRLTPVRSA